MGMSFDCYFEYCEGVNISVQIFTWTYVFNSLGYVPRSGYMNKNVPEKQKLITSNQT